MRKTNKVLTMLILAGVLTFSQLVAPLLSFAAPYSKVDGTYQMLDGSKIEGVIARGIDVSHWQGVIDWSNVSKDDVTFAMLGTRYSGNVDPNFHTNATNAANQEIKLGAYIYSYATTVDMALQEADFILNLIKDYPISYPVAYDVEDNVQSSLSPQEVSALINAFCGRIAEAGYYPIIYANDYWLANKIDLSLVNYDVWVARYEIKHAYKQPVMWQATSTGSINGIKGNVDINFQYKDFTPFIPADCWKTIAGNQYYYKDFKMVKDSWINDHTGWFYLNQNGLAHKGWLNQSNKSYYLDESSGRMLTNWKQLDQSWYYFNPSGDLATGWITDNGISYFANNEGKMQTGWLQQNGVYYYLNSSGVMTTGWSSIDNQWYYFNDIGSMKIGWINDNGIWYYTGNDGKMKTGWLSDQGQTYYLDPNSGAMTANTSLTIDGISYSINESGVCEQTITDANPADGSTIIPANPESPPDSGATEVGPGI